MKFTEHSRNIHEVRFPRLAAGETFPLLLTSDWHFDNIHCDRELLFSHLDEAKENGALVCCFGDLLCLMQGKYDKRSNKADIRPEHCTGNYLDSVINDTAEKLKPWHDILWILSPGNHESAVSQRHETNVMERLVQAIKYMTPTSPVVLGGYGGWAITVMERPSDVNATGALAIKYFHGHGGGGPVTKGAIQQQRAAVIYEGADIVYMGHVHEHQSTVYVKEKLGYSKKRVELTEQEHLRGATYKEEYGDGHGNWHVETGKPPKPLGGWWVDVFIQKRKREQDLVKLSWESRRAK